MYRRTKQTLLLIAFLAFGFSALAQVTAPDFSVVVLPDTQFYAQSYPQIFNQQTQWIVNNQANYNIQFVLGEGDVVNTAEQAVQWQSADAAVKLLDNANIPYVMAIGNHDYGNEDPSTRDSSAFNSYFGPARYAQYSWYMGGYPSGTNDNFYTVFTVNGQQYLILALEFVPQDATLVWAKSVLDANPDKEIIVLAHTFTFTDATRADQCDNDDIPATGNNQGEDVWQKLLINYPNLSLVLNGHSFAGANAARRADLGLQQNLVNQILADYQNLANGGDGWMRIMTFRPLLNRI
ncbi:MAG: metallophosphoesterase, partial [Acidobacteriaceae bacterium]